MAEVTEFNIAYKYISILYIGFLTILNPLWSASTEAYVKGDLAWIKNCMRRLNQLWILIMVIGGIILIVLSPFLYQIWLKSRILPDLTLLILMLLYFASLTRTAMYRYFMNGVGKIKLQLYVTTVQSLLHIPIAIILGIYFGIYGVVSSMILWNILNIVWEPLQFKKIVNQTVKGIWNK